MKPGDLFVVHHRCTWAKEFLRVFHENRGNKPYEMSDCFEVPINSNGIFLETVGKMHLILFPGYGKGWVYDDWLNKEDHQ
jgi:hypothetical protein